jgi:two-component system, chemotaxis family, protein-glutamate methylesterase/glutaminase
MGVHASPQLRSVAPEHERIRVLIVDDSVVARAVLARLLSDHADIDVVGAAGSAPAAFQILAEKRVDIILLDLEMPGIHGMAALPELIARGRGARVLIVSSACADGATASIAALRNGAADTMLKPSAAAFAGAFADDLVDRLRRIARPGTCAPRPSRLQAATATPPLRKARRIECLGIGASTGGVPALAAFFQALPDSFDAPIVLTQHLPEYFMPYFAAQLVEMTGRPTRLAAPGLQPIRGEILLAPGDAHLTLVKTGSVIHVRLERKRSASGCLPSVDPMFNSIGRLYGPGAVGVVLSGMGRDGAQGAEQLVAAGGAVVAQDADSSVVWGMPGAIAEGGFASVVATPAELARRIAEWDEGNAAWT